MKRRSYQAAKRRDRKTSQRVYTGPGYHYPFPTGKAALADRERRAGKQRNEEHSTAQ